MLHFFLFLFFLKKEQLWRCERGNINSCQLQNHNKKPKWLRKHVSAGYPTSHGFSLSYLLIFSSHTKFHGHKGCPFLHTHLTTSPSSPQRLHLSFVFCFHKTPQKLIPRFFQFSNQYFAVRYNFFFWVSVIQLSVLLHVFILRNCPLLPNPVCFFWPIN